ncbi:RES family NAD+ phosphorylase [Inquilinus sp. CA228]|uniref:RES family NAD+ phosphorylase n=1 Tax=Inquilinus sp. CA228 TaxID=3455609 RepID=UPI003F8D29B3
MALPASLPVVEIQGPVFRCHRIQYGYRYFGKSAAGRYDDPKKQYGVLYLGATREAAFAETCLRDVGGTLLDRQFLAARATTEVAMDKVRLAQAYGAGLAALGQTAIISASAGYDDSQIFSRWIFDHRDEVDGIAYFSRHDNEQLCIALFDRAAPALKTPAGAGGEPMSKAPWLDAMLDRYRIGLAP